MRYATLFFLCHATAAFGQAFHKVPQSVDDVFFGVSGVVFGAENSPQKFIDQGVLVPIDATGLFIVELIDGTTRGTIRTLDIVTTINGINVASTKDLSNAKASCVGKRTVKVSVLRPFFDRDGTAEWKEVSATLKPQSWMAFVNANTVSETDEFNGITTITHRNAPKIRFKTFVDVHLRTKGKQQSTFLLVHYKADWWMFFEKVTLKVDDVTFKFLAEDVTRDNGVGWIAEWLHIPLDDQSELKLAIRNATSLQVRFENTDFYKDFDATEHLPRMKRMLFIAANSP